jgi:hypothetical protein
MATCVDQLDFVGLNTIQFFSVRTPEEYLKVYRAIMTETDREHISSESDPSN